MRITKSHVTGVELLAMPKRDYMNSLQLDFFRDRLLAQQQDLLANANASVSLLRDDTNATADPADRATIEEEHALELRVRDRERKLLKKINSALARIADGSYGYCLETGEAIGLPRLLARPQTEYSIEAQERHERKEKQHG